MRYKLDFFKNTYYAVPIDAWEIWVQYKRNSDLYGVKLPDFVWEYSNLDNLTFTDPQIQ